jgi:sec-independent protein translocase protein TatC
MLGMGLGFELPVVILVLVKLGVLNYTILSKARRYMIVINLILGALLTTPEVLTQVLMAVPLQVLFEISVWIAWYWERQEKKRAAAEEAGTAG